VNALPPVSYKLTEDRGQPSISFSRFPLKTEIQSVMARGGWHVACGMWHIFEEEKCIQNSRRNPEGKDYSEDLSVDETILKRDIKKWLGKARTRATWLRIGIRDGLLWTRHWTFGFHKIRLISWITEEIVAVASQEDCASCCLVTWSVGQSVSQSVGRSVSQSVGRSVGQSVS
jgi:hypothetical protein